MKKISAVFIVGFMFFLAFPKPLHTCVGRLLVVAVTDSTDQVIMGQMLSLLINERTGMHFYDFVNRYRVEEAKRLLRESILRDELSILGIAYEVGFNSKSSFNTAFKKAAGITPSQYRNAYLRSVSRN